MPLYPGPANATAWSGPYTPPTQQIPIGDLPYVLFNEVVVVGQSSIAVHLGKKDDSPAGTVSIEGFFTLAGVPSAPGAFEIDFQTSDTDADGMYQQEGLGITAATAVAQSFRGEFNNVTANFGRVNLKSLANATVKLTLRIMRQ